MAIDDHVWRELCVEMTRVKTKDAKRALANVAYRLHKGLPPFPSEVDGWISDMEYQGKAIERLRADAIAEKLGVKREVKG